MKFTHVSWVPLGPINSEEDFRRELLLLAAEYKTCQAYSAIPMGPEMINRDVADRLCLESFLRYARRGERITMPIPGASFMLFTDIFAKAVGDWDSDREQFSGTCIHYSTDCPLPKGEGIVQCPSLKKTPCPSGEHCKEKNNVYENRRFGKVIPPKFADILEKIIREAEEIRTGKKIETKVGSIGREDSDDEYESNP